MKLELLAPAGSYEGFMAAVNAGADAVYLGGNAFGARAYAANLGEEELLRAIDTVRILDKKLYLTVNTLVKNTEFEALYDFLRPLYERGLDAVIVQDTGVLLFIRKYFPELAIHASTQMAVTGPSGAALLENEGVKRVIPARELSLREIKAIRDHTDLEIECFIHGALCYCYSGQCLMSSMMGGRSGNRGRCGGACRLPYTVLDRKGVRVTKKDGSDAFSLNTKDICLVSYITEMAECGVTSFKIEGRMKSPEYTAGVVGIYRKYIDLYEKGERNVPPGKADLKTLEGLFNREGFGKSYLFVHNGPEMMAVHGEAAKHSEEVYKRVREEMKGRVCRRVIDLKFRAEEGYMTLEAVMGERSVSAGRSGPEKAQNRPADASGIEKQLRKTGGTLFEAGRVEIELKGDLFIPVKELNALRREVLEKAGRNAGRSAAGQEEHPFVRENGSGILTPDRAVNSVVTVSALCSDPEQIRILLESGCIHKIYVPYRICKEQGADGIRKMFGGYGTEPALALPFMRGVADDPESGRVIEEAKDGGMEILVRNIEDAALLLEKGCTELIRLDHGIYTMNGFAQNFWRGQGILKDTVPWELNEKELLERDNTDSELTVYGRIPLMISAQCLAKTYGRCRQDHSGMILKDRKGFCFPVSFACDFCYNIIYNSVPESLVSLAGRLKKLNAGGFRFEFTDESPDEAVRLIRAFQENCEEASRGDGSSVKEWFEFTRGHFNRGVL